MSVFGKKELQSNVAGCGQDRSPSPAMVYFVLCSATLFSIVYVASIYRAVHQGHLTFVVIGLLAFKTLVEVGSSYYGFAFLFMALAYMFRREGESEFKLVDNPPPVGLIYLCCNDLDRDAQIVERVFWNGEDRLPACSNHAAAFAVKITCATSAAGNWSPRRPL